MEMFISSLIQNILCSIVYDIGKKFILNEKKPLSEKQILDIIDPFREEFSCLLEKIAQVETDLDCIQKQNEAIFKLLLMIFDNQSNIAISYSNKGYLLDGDYSLDNLHSIVQLRIDGYAKSLSLEQPRNLGEAIWPLSREQKGALLNEIERNLYSEDI